MLVNCKGAWELMSWLGSLRDRMLQTGLGRARRTKGETKEEGEHTTNYSPRSRLQPIGYGKESDGERGRSDYTTFQRN